MNLFSRSMAVNSTDPAGGFGFSVEIARYVSKASGVEVTPWTTVYGAPLGIVSFSCRVDSLAAMGAVNAKLTADKGYADLLAKGAGKLVGPIEDVMSQFVTMSGEPNLGGKYDGIISAQVAGGKIGEAMGWSVDILNHVTKVTGIGGLLVRGLFGPWATLAWIGLYESLDQLDEAEAAQASDGAYVKKLDKGGNLFVDGSAQQRLLQRLS
jgi:hypothetical protein